MPVNSVSTSQAAETNEKGRGFHSLHLGQPPLKPDYVFLDLTALLAGDASSSRSGISHRRDN